MAATRRQIIFTVNLTFLLLGLGLIAIGAASENYEALAAGCIALGVLAFVAPITKWGAAGLLLTTGIIVLLAGVLVWGGGTFGTAAAKEAHQDNDADGKENEDPFGDADNSASDPTKVDGANELTTPEDDDGDGQVDEDPFAPAGVQTAAETLVFVGQALTVAGAAMVALFGFILSRRSPRRVSA